MNNAEETPEVKQTSSTSELGRTRPPAPSRIADSAEATSAETVPAWSIETIDDTAWVAQVGGLLSDLEAIEQALGARAVKVRQLVIERAIGRTSATLSSP